MTMVAFELFAIAHNLNAELSTLGIDQLKSFFNHSGVMAIKIQFASFFS